MIECCRCIYDSSARTEPRELNLPEMGEQVRISGKQRRDYREKLQQNGGTQIPKKKFYRQRAHANPFSDHQLT
jgi:hypothetical protein